MENISSYGACRFEKTSFEKNGFEVLSCVHSTGSRMRDVQHASGKTRN